MTPTPSQSDFVRRRADLMAELFLEGFGPQFLSRPTSPDVGYDLLAGFLNGRGGINTFAVEVRAIERPPGSSVKVQRDIFDRFARSNIPGLLLVADVKANRLHYGWLAPGGDEGAASVSIRVAPVDEAARNELRLKFESSSAGVLAVH